MALKITQTLFSAWEWMYKTDDGEADFLRTLRRERGEQSPAMLAGIAFENWCYAAAQDWEHVAPTVPPEFMGGVSQIVPIITGGAFQVKVWKPVTIGGTDFLLYGILDALKCGTIYDIKYKNKSFNSLKLDGAYRGSPQHPMYFRLVHQAEEFQYLVSDGADLYIETYRPEDVEPIDDEIQRFAEFLRREKLWDLYVEKWTVQP